MGEPFIGNKMLIKQDELVREWLILKEYGLTDEEIKGMIEFFDYEIILKNTESKKCINPAPTK